MALALKGVILVGGPSVGTRFRPLSMDCPKPLFPIAGVPMIHHHVSSLARTPGMREILLVGFFENSVFDRFITETSIEFPSVSIRYLREYQSLGTGGGVYHFRDEILRGNPDAFFVLNADIASSFPFSQMISFHRQHNAVGTVMGIHVEKSKLNRYGCIVQDEVTSQVIHFVEKPETFISDLISCGIYLLSASVFSYFQKAITSRRAAEVESGIQSGDVGLGFTAYSSSANLFPRNDERIQLEQDVLRTLADERVLYVYTASPRDFWMQIKQGSTTIPANRNYLQYFLESHPRRLSETVTVPLAKRTSLPGFDQTLTIEGLSIERGVSAPSHVRQAMAPTPAPILTKANDVAGSPVNVPELNVPQTAELLPPVYIHPTAVIHPTAKIGPNVSIGPRALVHRGVRIRDAIILDGVEIKNDACVLNAVVGWGSKIGAWARIEGSADQDERDEEAATFKGFKVPSAAILGKNVIISDEIIIRDCIVLPHKELKHSFQREILM